jgi:hypothetical protein
MEIEKESLTCPICKKSFDSLRQLSSHKIVHSSKLIKCSKCGKFYKPGKEWFAHLNFCYPKHHTISEELRQKLSIIHKGKSPWNKGKHFSEETRRKISLARKGKIPWNKGLNKNRDIRIAKYSEKIKHPKKLSLEVKEKLKLNIKKAIEAWKLKYITDPLFREKIRRIAQENGKKFKPTGEKLRKIKQKISISSKKLWQNPEYREKTIKAILRGLRKRPSTFEQKIINLCKKYNLPFKYVGNGEVIINYVNPDFIETNGKKLLIEVYNSFFHPKDYEEKRAKRFAKYGYKTLFLNENDIETKNWEEICLNKIREFIESDKVLEGGISNG